MRGQNTGGYYRCLMYIGHEAPLSVHKKPRRIGPGLCVLQKILIRRRWVNKARRRAEAYSPGPHAATC